jgi:hypothetical protein
MSHQITERTHVANIALTHKLACGAVEFTSAMLARVEVNTRPLIVEVLLLHVHWTRKKQLFYIFAFA